MRAFLGHVGGRQVDGDPLGGHGNGHGGQRAADPVAGLADGLTVYVRDTMEFSSTVKAG